MQQAGMSPDQRLAEVLVCPSCRHALALSDDGAECRRCARRYPRAAGRPLDLRLRDPARVTIDIEVGREHGERRPRFGLLQHNPRPEVAFEPADLPPHLTPEMASYIPRARSPRSLCLDLGCGAGDYRVAVEKAGYTWLGIDYAHPRAPLWADAHALPLADASFDLVLSLAVLEHIRQPTVMLRELRRVLRPGGVFLGSVTYLVPFHDAASYFNMTHYGVWSALEDAGLDTEFVLGEPAYSGLRALAFEGLFPGLPRALAYALVEPVAWLHRLYWHVKRWRGNPRFTHERQQVLNTGAFVFRAHKADADEPRSARAR